MSGLEFVPSANLILARTGVNYAASEGLNWPHCSSAAGRYNAGVMRPSLVAGVLAAAVSLCPGLEARFSGQASVRITARQDTGFAAEGELRYIPALTLAQPIGRAVDLDLEAALDARLNAARRPGKPEISADLEPYRAWVRLGAQRFETRVGLQKLAFGSALLLRPLQWFDRLDPRDPTGVTGGVWAALGRYWFAGNANLWAWGLLGNTGPRPWELLEGARWIPEAGARLQMPVPRGEAALSFHHRTALDTFGGRIPEDRLGIDAKLDLGIGLWAEAVLLHEWTDLLPLPWQRAAVLGADYTLPFGNGLALTAEHLSVARAAGPLAAAGVTAGDVSGVMVGYNVGLLDRLSGMGFYDWSNREAQFFAAWQHTLDRWVFQLAGFWGPADAVLPGTGGDRTGGRGLRFSAVFNH